MDLIKIPKRFYIDHKECGLECPPIVKETKSHYWIDASSEFVGGLLDRADFYSTMTDWPRFCFGLCKSAAATADAIRKHQQAA